MGWRTVVDVRDYSRATGSTYTVAIVLAERAPDETRIARPGIKRLAIDAHCDRSTAQRALKELEASGEIERLGEPAGRGRVAQFLVVVGPELYAGVPYEQTRSDWEGPQDATLSGKGPHLAQKGPQAATHSTAKGPRAAARTEPTTDVGSETEENRGGRADALAFCQFLTRTADEENRASYPDTQLEAAAWLLDNVPRRELHDVVTWAAGRTYWAPRVRTAGKLRRAWKDLRVEWRAATHGGRGRRVGRSGDDLRAEAERLRAEGR